MCHFENLMIYLYHEGNMNKFTARIKQISLKISEKIAAFFRPYAIHVRNFCLKIYNLLINNEDRESRRIQTITFGIMLVFIYASISIIVGRNPLAVFRSLPVIDKRVEITIFFPDIDGKTILEEKRKIQLTDNYEVLVREMTEMIVKGSNFENTRLAVPFEGIIRSFWIDKDRCIVDFRLSMLDDAVAIVPGSEEMFKESLARTIKKNIPGIKEVIVMENGIYGRNLWENGN